MLAWRCVCVFSFVLELRSRLDVWRCVNAFSAGFLIVGIGIGMALKTLRLHQSDSSRQSPAGQDPAPGSWVRGGSWGGSAWGGGP